MASLLEKLSRKAGQPPGTLVHIGERKDGPPAFTGFHYGEGFVEESRPASIAEALAPSPGRGIHWLNIDGLHDMTVIEAVGARFGIHPLTLEDIVTTAQRPKVEIFDRYVFVTVQMIRFDRERGRVRSEQVSLLFGGDFLVSFQESPGDVFEPVRARLREGRGKIRCSGPDYLAYCLLDAVVDQYFDVLEGLSGETEAIEREIVEAPETEELEDLHRLRHELAYLRRRVWPIRELLMTLKKADTELVHAEIHPYLADVHDHAVQVLEIVESLRDVVSGLQDLYLTQVSLRMNSVMKVLTLIATIFIPITFIAGVFGMNFRYMPELEQPWGYPAALGLMAVVAVGLLVYFRRNHWL